MISGNITVSGWHERIALKTYPVFSVSRDTPRFYPLAAFLVGFLQPISIVLVGVLPLSELLLLAVLTHAAVALALARTLPARFPSPRVLAFLLICQVVALGSYIVSDLWRQSLPFDMIRGWLRMTFLLVDTAAMALLFGTGNRTFILFQIGLCLSSLLTLLNGPLFGDYWKFCFGYPTTIFILLAVPRFFGLWATAAAAFLLGILHLMMDYRSLGMQCVLLAGLLIAVDVLPRLLRKYLFIICVPITLAALPWAGKMLFADAEARANRSNVERSAMLQAAWEGFLASPLIGNGSWFSRSDVWDNFLL
ncbi:MAG TPA: hypothetical protein VIT23_06955, partial [Terrimicrobiaceae bacterium]